MRHRLVPFALAALCALPFGCGGRFDLPTERPGGDTVPSDQSYAMLATWPGMNGVQDLVLESSQLLVLFNHGGSGGPSVPRGEVRLYPRKSPKPIGPPYFNPVRTLFNPIAIAAGGNRMFVLDQGDSCMAKFDARIGTCEPDVSGEPGRPYRSQVHDYTATWRVREYALRGGDTLSTFTDTTVSQPWGIAADTEGRVYVAGIATVLDTNQLDQRIRTRKFVSRVYRYSRGTRYPDVLDVNMPGTSSWHRDTTWLVFDGTGASSVSDPRGLHWSPVGTSPLFVADRGNNQVKGVSSNSIAVSVVRVDGQATGANFNRPEGVRADLAGYFYVVDRENRRVLRYRVSDGEFIQRVDVEPNESGLPLLDPVSIAVDDSLAYIADRGRAEIIRYERRP